MKERSKPTKLSRTASLIFGFAIGINMFLSILEPGWLALILLGLATGSMAGAVALEVLKHYGDHEGRELSGSRRRKMAFTGGIVFGAAVTSAIVLAGLPFIVGLVVGSGLSDRVRRTLGFMIRANPSRGNMGDPEDEHDFRMPRFASDSTRDQFAAAAVMMLGFALSAGVLLAGYAGLLAIMGR